MSILFVDGSEYDTGETSFRLAMRRERNAKSGTD
jgi:hypothetical protein